MYLFQLIPTVLVFISTLSKLKELNVTQHKRDNQCWSQAQINGEGWIRGDRQGLGFLLFHVKEMYDADLICTIVLGGMCL